MHPLADELLSVDELAQRLKIEPKTVYSLTRT
jgi:DNA-binding transcriptional regulator YhcF (GntR family)